MAPKPRPKPPSQADLRRWNTWTCCVCGGTAVRIGAVPHGWITLIRYGAPEVEPWNDIACSLGCAHEALLRRREASADTARGVY